MAAMIWSSQPQFGQCSMSISNTRLSSRAQLILETAVDRFLTLDTPYEL